MVHSLVYLSSATSRFTSDELGDTLTVSRRNNAADEVTGVLLHRDGNLLQVLEGERAVVRALFGRIERDVRRHGVITIWEAGSAGRQFPDWSMAFHDLADVDPTSTPGFNRFLTTPLTVEVLGPEPTLVQQLLIVVRDQYATQIVHREG